MNSKLAYNLCGEVSWQFRKLHALVSRVFTYMIIGINAMCKISGPMRLLVLN
jgi:hypothetical protein